MNRPSWVPTHEPHITPYALSGTLDNTLLIPPFEDPLKVVFRWYLVVVIFQ